MHGAGHAAASARAHAWLTGTLGREDNALGQHPDGLRRLVAGFPRRDRFGGEITPLLPDVWYMGGQLGPALPVAHGMALDAPYRLVVALVGDGEKLLAQRLQRRGSASGRWNIGSPARCCRCYTQRPAHGRPVPAGQSDASSCGGCS